MAKIVGANEAIKALERLCLIFLLVFIIQFGIGYILDLWGPDESGAYPVVAYNYAFGMLIIIEILFFSWMLLNIRRLKINF